MRIDPALSSLIADPAPLFGAAERARAWRSDPEARPVLAELAAYGEGASLATCPALRELSGKLEMAQRLAQGALGPLAEVLAGAPLTLWPDRHFTNGVLHSLTLAASGQASLSLALIDGAAWRAQRDPRASRVAAFQPGELHAIVLAGAAAAALLTNLSDDPSLARIDARPLSLAPGVAYACDGARETLALETIPRLLMTLRLHRRAESLAPARQYDVSSGALIGQAAAASRDSRAEMTMALLRAMGRADAAPAIADLARTGEPAARWQALRECLALDSAVGFAALLRVTTDRADPLASSAAALVETLASRHPAFATAREASLCPA